MALIERISAQRFSTSKWSGGSTTELFIWPKDASYAERRFYVPTDFDTIEKAFSGVKTAEKGIKQGLSRSITDSESPFSLYSVVDFCRSKVRRHRGV